MFLFPGGLPNTHSVHRPKDVTVLLNLLIDNMRTMYLDTALDA